MYKYDICMQCDKKIIEHEIVIRKLKNFKPTVEFVYCSKKCRDIARKTLVKK